MSHKHAPYLANLIPTKERQETVRKSIEILSKFDFEFDTIAVTGVSGLLVGPEIASRMNKELIVVRKPGDNSHSFCQVEGYYDAKKYIILDDLVDTGNTVRIVRRKVSEFCAAPCFGVMEVWYVNRPPSQCAHWPFSDLVRLAQVGRKTSEETALEAAVAISNAIERRTTAESTCQIEIPF